MTRLFPIVAAAVLGAVTSLWPADVLAQGCAMCGNSLGAGDPFSNALNTSILFMMAAPYALAAGVAVWLVWSYRRAHPRHRADVIDFPWPHRSTHGPKEDPS
jgi:hypothetical protein